MKSLIKEASIDDQFNAQMNKIQQAIIALEQLVPELVSVGPVSSQRGAIHRAVVDLTKIHEDLRFKQ